MYCPSCGSNNQAELKFCTRCGTNLGVVSEALTGKLAGQAGVDDHVAKLMRDYYRGRRDTITGGVLIPAGLGIMAILVASGMHPIGAFFIVFWMFIWGAMALASGLGRWIASSAEMKSLGIGSQSQFRGSAPQALAEPAANPREQPGFSTEPVDFPGSATEHTTRQLSERAASPKREPERRQ
jgi:hypothetical protein